MGWRKHSIPLPFAKARLARSSSPACHTTSSSAATAGCGPFFRDADYREYLALLVEWRERQSARILAYCLMPIHVHPILVPDHPDGLARAVGEVNRRYTLLINDRNAGAASSGRGGSTPSRLTTPTWSPRLATSSVVRTSPSSSRRSAVWRGRAARSGIAGTWSGWDGACFPGSPGASPGGDRANRSGAGVRTMSQD